MSIQREQIYSALFNLLNGALLTPTGSFVTISRRLTAASQLSRNDMPALFLAELGERYEQPLLGGPAKVTLLAQLYMYVMCDEQSDNPSTDINNLSDAIEDALAPIPALGVQTLGNIVQHAWIEGRISDYIASAAGRLSISLFEVGMLVDH